MVAVVEEIAEDEWVVAAGGVACTVGAVKVVSMADMGAGGTLAAWVDLGMASSAVAE